VASTKDARLGVDEKFSPLPAPPQSLLR